MRTKYRSAVYTFSKIQKQEAEQILESLQNQFKNKLTTKVLPFESFKASREQIQNYYFNNPKKPFCESFINPKLKVLLNQFSNAVNQEKLKHLKNEQYKTEYSE